MWYPNGFHKATKWVQLPIEQPMIMKSNYEDHRANIIKGIEPFILGKTIEEINKVNPDTRIHIQGTHIEETYMTYEYDVNRLTVIIENGIVKKIISIG